MPKCHSCLKSIELAYSFCANCQKYFGEQAILNLEIDFAVFEKTIAEQSINKIYQKVAQIHNLLDNSFLSRAALGRYKKYVRHSVRTICEA